MANNFPRNYGDPARTVLHANDLAEGDTLVRLIESGGRWGGNVTYRTVEMVVVKVLKTRLVLKDPVTDRTIRVLLESGKYNSYAHGEVTSTIEGSSPSYNRPSMLLATPGDEGLAERIAKHDTRNAEVLVKQEASKAREAFKASMTIDNAEATIAALQAWVAAQAK